MKRPPMLLLALAAALLVPPLSPLPVAADPPTEEVDVGTLLAANAVPAAVVTRPVFVGCNEDGFIFTAAWSLLDNRPGSPWPTATKTAEFVMLVTPRDLPGEVPGIPPPDWVPASDFDVVTYQRGNIRYLTAGAPAEFGFRDSDSDTVLDSGEAVYLAQSLTGIGVNYLRVRNPPGAFGLGSQVAYADSDAGAPLHGLGGSSKYLDDDASGSWSAGDTWLWDIDSSSTWSVGDFVLSGSSAGALVTSTDPNLGSSVNGLTLATRFFDADGSGTYSLGDDVYQDNDASLTASAGDVRLRGSSEWGFGGVVSGDDADAEPPPFSQSGEVRLSFQAPEFVRYIQIGIAASFDDGGGWVEAADVSIVYLDCNSSPDPAHSLCGVDPADLEAYDHVFVSEDVSFDPSDIYDVDEGVTWTLWPLEAYRCLYPTHKPDQELASQRFTVADWALQPDVFENLTEIMSPTPNDEGYALGDFVMDPTAASYIGDSYSTSSTACDDNLPEGHCGTGPRRAAAGVINIMMVTPKPDHWQHTDGGCKYEVVRAAADKLEAISRSGMGWSPPVSAVFFNVVCDLSRLWNPDDPAGSDTCSQTTDPAWTYRSNAGQMLDRVYHFGRSNGIDFVSEPNQLVLGWAWAAKDNGIACRQPYHTAFGVETCRDASYRGDLYRDGNCPDWAEKSIALHEMGHLFGADHYPNDGYRKYLCRQSHAHAWNNYHVHNYNSVMNFCWAAQGYMDFDYDNYWRVFWNMQDTSA